MNIRNFHGKNLYTCEASSLQYADLRGADLRWTYLRGAALACANLQGTDLQEANLVGAKHLSPLTAAQLFVPPASRELRRL